MLPISFSDFATKVYPSLQLTPFHLRYYRVLELFARGKIKKLIITMPPQHGKSVGSSVLLPAYMLGLDPDSKIAIASYNATLANRFNRRVQRIIDTREYADIFPSTTIKGVGQSKSNYVRTSDRVEVIGMQGELISVGREGALTGNQVDIFLLDDLYKDAIEANSPIIRENCWEWYTSVVKTRMHNKSQELIVFTRWHEEDLIGMIENKERIVELQSWSDIDSLPHNSWLRLNFEAIKESPPTEIDPRQRGEVLWEERHNKELLTDKRALDHVRFEALYQGKPSSKEGLLYGDNFATYTTIPKNIIKKGNYTDTADSGEDYLCSVCYDVSSDGEIFITDVVYSQERMEVTETLVAKMLNDTLTRQALIESNNGGRGFARAVAKMTPMTSIEWFHQSANKEARIVSNSASVVRFVRMPCGWKERWGELHRHLTTYRRLFRSNRFHDAADTITGIVEREVTEVVTKKIKAISFKG